MLIVRIAGKDYPIANRHDETVLGISAEISSAFKQTAKTKQVETNKLALAEAAQRGDKQAVERLAAKIERATKE